VSAQPIGIFDSGMGGLTVALALNQRLPNEQLVYLGDTARVPYGTKSPDTVVKYARRNMQFMRTHQVKAVVVACNTVSAQGVKTFTQKEDPPVFGVIEPGARMANAVSTSGKVAILATPGTIRSNAYPIALRALNPSIDVFQVACPLFVPLAEEGWMDHEVTNLVAETYLSELIGTGVDTIILGCTHYPLLESVITIVAERLLGHHVKVINSATVVAETVDKALAQLNLRSSHTCGAHTFYATDVSHRSQVVADRFWQGGQRPAPVFEHVDLPN